MIYISYFYQIRFFSNTIIPVSTAIWDPKWYHDGKGQNHLFLDKNNVINGLRFSMLSPKGIYNVDTDCHKGCTQNPNTCSFMRKYGEWLNALDFDDTIKLLNDLIDSIPVNYKFDICLMVHEAPDNKCSERVVLQQWFKNNGQELPEWTR